MPLGRQMVVTDDDLEVASDVAAKVVQNACFWVAAKFKYSTDGVETPYAQMLLAQHVKVQCEYLRLVKMDDEVRVALTAADSEIDVNLKTSWADPINVSATVSQE
jgi:hypothetical protein